MSEEKKAGEKRQPKMWEDVVHVAINELAPWATNELLDHLPKEIYDKLIQNSHKLQTILPVVSGAILRITKNAEWADSLTVTGLARIREEIEKRADGKKGVGPAKKVEKKEQEKKIILGPTIREVLPSIDVATLNVVIARMRALPRDKKEALLDSTIVKDKAVVICTNLANCDETLFEGMVDMLIVPIKPETKEVCFKEELVKHPSVARRLNDLQENKRGVVRRHLEHIPHDQIVARLVSLEVMSDDEFAVYVDAVILVRPQFEKWIENASSAVKDFFDEVREKRGQQGGFLAGFKEGRENYRNRRRR